MTTEPERIDVDVVLPPPVHSTSAWVHRCAKRMLELDPELDPLAAMYAVDDMATSSRWRAMPPEAVAEAICSDERGHACRVGGTATRASVED